MIGVIATFEIVEGKEAEFEKAANALVEAVTANEAGVRTYRLYRDQKPPHAYLMMEEYLTADDLDAHGKTEHMARLGAKIGPLLASPPKIQKFDSID